MIVQAEFLKKIKDFGLNSYEAKLWTALLSRGVSTAGELSDIANVPRSRSYDVLETLEKKGFVVMKRGKPIKYIAVPPTEVVERVKKNMRINAEEKIKRLETLKESDLLKELETLHTEGIELVDPSELSGSLRGRHNLYNHLELTIRNAEESVTMMTTSTGLLRKLDGLSGTFEKLKKRGVKIRVAAPLTKEAVEAAKLMKDLVEVRHTNSNARFTVVDSKEVIFMVLNDAEVHQAYDVGIWVNTPFFAGALEELFELAWKDMKPLANVKL